MPNKASDDRLHTGLSALTGKKNALPACIAALLVIPASHKAVLAHLLSRPSSTDWMQLQCMQPLTKQNMLFCSNARW